jgi:hypothetical protein
VQTVGVGAQKVEGEVEQVGVGGGGGDRVARKGGEGETGPAILLVGEEAAVDEV